jgi:hypothetical protein
MHLSHSILQPGIGIGGRAPKAESPDPGRHEEVGFWASSRRPDDLREIEQTQIDAKGARYSEASRRMIDR